MERTVQVLDADYVMEDGTAVVRLFCVDDEGEPLVAYDEGFRPYVYVVPEQDAVEGVRDRLDGLVVDDEGEPRRVVAVEPVERVDGRERVTALQVCTATPPDVPPVKDEVAGWEPVRGVREFDVPFYKRYLIDNDLRPAAPVTLTLDAGADRPVVTGLEAADAEAWELSMLAFDLEVYEDEIIMASVYGDGVDTVLVRDRGAVEEPYAEVVEDEAALIERLLAVVDAADPDVVLGYNTDEYDFPVLRERAEAHGVTLRMGRTDRRMVFTQRGRFKGANLEGRAHLDLYAYVENIVSMGMDTETLTLDAVAQELLDAGTEDVSWEELQRFWREGEELDRLAAYARRDAELTYRLGEALVPQVLSLARLTGLPPFDVCRHTYGQLVENFLLRRAHDDNRLAPNRPTREERRERFHAEAYTGGYVYEPEEGLAEDIALFDFRSLYPTIMVAHNISPDTLAVPDCGEEEAVEVPEAGETYRFCQDEQGFIPGILEELVGERYELKAELSELDADAQAYRDMDTRQNALKILSNAFYGYMGYAGARWYSRPCAAATTALGRRYIRETIEEAEDAGLEVVYGDTDSVFLTGDDIRDRAERFQERVNAELPQFMALEYEGFYTRGLFTSTDEGEGAKKKYALLDAEGEVKITGFEQVRRDWSPVAKDTQERVIRRVLEGDVEGAVEAVRETIDRLQEGDVPLRDLRIYTQMNKNPENYASTAPHVAAARKAKKRGREVSAGETIAYVVTAGGGTVSDRAELLEFAESYDASYYIDNQVIPVALRVLKVFGYDRDRLRGKGRQTGLESFG